MHPGRQSPRRPGGGHSPFFLHPRLSGRRPAALSGSTLGRRAGRPSGCRWRTRRRPRRPAAGGRTGTRQWLEVWVQFDRTCGRARCRFRPSWLHLGVTGETLGERLAQPLGQVASGEVYPDRPADRQKIPGREYGGAGRRGQAGSSGGPPSPRAARIYVPPELCPTSRRAAPRTIRARFVWRNPGARP